MGILRLISKYYARENCFLFFCSKILSVMYWITQTLIRLSSSIRWLFVVIESITVLLSVKHIANLWLIAVFHIFFSVVLNCNFIWNYIHNSSNISYCQYNRLRCVIITLRLQSQHTDKLIVDDNLDQLKHVFNVSSRTSRFKVPYITFSIVGCPCCFDSFGSVAQKSLSL